MNVTSKLRKRHFLQRPLVARQRGFALVISLTLMVLLTVLAIGLLSLSTISLRASSQGEAMQISARSDSFHIRSYGESVDPTGKVIAPAWCQAVVQRIPDFVDPADEPKAAIASLKPASKQALRAPV